MNSRSDAIMLLTVYLGGTNSAQARPLSPKEWAKFASWLSQKNLTPESLLNADLVPLLEGWVDSKVNRLRLEKLLSRGAALGLAMEKWTRAGLWVMTRSDADYPKRLLKRLGKISPPVLFGCGKKSLLNSSGVSIVGSRNVSDEDADFTSNLGKRVANSGLSVVSGGARGVDQLAMLGALNASGTSIGVLADSLLTSSMSKKYREFIASGDLVLVSPFNPEARFNVGNAMGRNKYIYCISDAAVVVCSTPEKGGTWNGAIENIVKEWVPLWVKENPSISSGNGLLKNRGANWFPEFADDLNVLLKSHSSIVSKPERTIEIISTLAATDTETTFKNVKSEHLDLYSVFLIHSKALTKEHALKIDELAEKLEVSKGQMNLWVKRAVADDALIKLNKPVRYKYRSKDSKIA